MWSSTNLVGQRDYLEINNSWLIISYTTKFLTLLITEQQQKSEYNLNFENT